MKTLDQIALSITEEEYRNDPALSYSTLSRFSKEGFHKLNKLFEPFSTPSTIFGGIVDTLITGTAKDFEDNYIITYLSLDDDTIQIIQAIYDTFKSQYNDFMKIPLIQVSQVAKQNGFWPADKWSDNARYNGLLKKGDVVGYYKFLIESEGKTVITNEQYQDAIKCVQALKTSEATRFYFAENEPNSSIQRYYQLKFKATFDGIDYRSMLDTCLVDYANKRIYPIDLKTSSHWEDEFYKSFIQFNYQLQSRLYYRNLEANVRKDDFFKDFEIEDYTFIVVNKNSLIPLTWRFKDTKTYGTLYYGKNKQIVVKDPFDIGKELNYYLTHQESVVQKGINLNKTNDIIEYLNELE